MPFLRNIPHLIIGKHRRTVALSNYCIEVCMTIYIYPIRIIISFSPIFHRHMSQNYHRNICRAR